MSKKSIDCKQNEKMIPLYLANRLSGKETLAFLKHAQNCPACKEELTIQYMVSEGLDMAERNNEYNLLAGLEVKINSSIKRIRHYRISAYAVAVFVFLSVIMFLAAAYLIIF